MTGTFSMIRRNAVGSGGIELARTILRQEALAIECLVDRLGTSFVQAVELVATCHGHVVVSGLGKAGLVGQKISATLASTGTPSYFLHPAEALHGDLGRIRRNDVVLALSHSGETSEVLRVVRQVAELQVSVIAMSGRPASRLAQVSTVLLDIGDAPEAGALQLAPSSSTTAMMALGDALALVASDQRGFTADDFARNHPGGSLGLQLSRVEQIMRPRSQCRVADMSRTVRDVLVDVGRPGRRSGAIMLVDEHDKLRGIFTDSDLVRLFEGHHESSLDASIAEVMTNDPKRVTAGLAFRDALQILKQHRISELPVVDPEQRPLGLIDITDIVHWLPGEFEQGTIPAGAGITLPLPRRLGVAS